MLNYVRHDEEFHCTIKLMNGDELVGRVIVTTDEETNKDVVYIEDPLRVKPLPKSRRRQSSPWYGLPSGKLL